MGGDPDRQSSERFKELVLLQEADSLMPTAC